MSSPKKRIRNKLISIWVANVASTAARDTLANDLQNKQLAPNFYLSCLYPTMKADIDA